MFLQAIGLVMVIVVTAVLSMAAAVSVLLGRDSSFAGEERDQEEVSSPASQM